MRADFKVVLDACVLANFGVCDLLLRLAAPPRLYLPVWSARILDEVHRTQTERLKKPWPLALADSFRTEVQRAFPAALIGGYDLLEPVLTNDPKDRHVLAAAIKAQASVIVTFNLKDFPDAAVQPWDSICRSGFLARHSLGEGGTPRFDRSPATVPIHRGVNPLLQFKTVRPSPLPERPPPAILRDIRAIRG